MIKPSFIIFFAAGISAPTLLSPAVALAAEDQTLLGSSLRMIWGLLIVLGVILILYALMRKRLTLMHGGDKALIKVLETRHLMPKKSLFLVEVRGRQYLLGSGSESIGLIAALDADQPAADRSFQDILQQSGQERAA